MRWYRARRWAALAPDDAVAGLTQVAVQCGTTLAYQWDTSVASGHRGRGLGLYISRELASYHGWKIQMDTSAPVIRQGRLNTFLVDLSEGAQ